MTRSVAEIMPKLSTRMELATIKTQIAALEKTRVPMGPSPIEEGFHKVDADEAPPSSHLSGSSSGQ